MGCGLHLLFWSAVVSISILLALRVDDPVVLQSSLYFVAGTALVYPEAAVSPIPTPVTGILMPIHPSFVGP